MAIYWWVDDEPPRVPPESPEARARDIDALFHRHDISYDATTLLALVRLTWKAAGELVYESVRTSSITVRRPNAAGRVRPGLG